MSQEDTRGLAAVMFADMVGFTALMGRDEAAARDARDRQRAVVDRLVSQFGGEVRQFYGDGTLSTFASAVQAARCAVEIQRELRQPPVVELRIGIHVGDIVDEGDGVYGDGVNVAARVEALAPTGGIVVSDRVFDEIKNQSGLFSKPLGEVTLKNVSRPVAVHALTNEGLAVPDGLPASVAPGAGAGEGEASFLRASFVRAAVVIAVVLLAGYGIPALTNDSHVADPDGAAIVRTLPSVAVIPFRNLSTAEEDAGFFAAGLHDDVLTQLAKIGSLDVIARTSVMRFADTETPIPEIARELGVQAVLEGGVQRAGDRIRLNAQLIDGRTDGHMWAETYDTVLTAENVFAIQTRLAMAIADALEAVLTGEEEESLSELPTSSLEAYDLYLRASVALRQDQGLSDLEVAEELLEDAIAIDPDFAEAYARLSYAHSNQYWNAFDRTEARRRMAGQALVQAESRARDNAEVLIARGYYRYWGFRDYEGAENAFLAAERTRPGDARIHEARAYVARRMGEWDRALVGLERAVSLDPLNAETLRALGQTYAMLARWSSAEDVYERASRVDPDRWSVQFDRALLALQTRGDPAPLRAVVEAFPDNRVVEMSRWWVAYMEGDDEGVFAVNGEAEAPFESQEFILPRPLANALQHHVKGRDPQARAAADSALAELETMVDSTPDDPRVHSSLGLAYAFLGRRDEAVAAGEGAVAMLPRELDAMGGPEYLKHLASIHLVLGDVDRAAALVADLLSRPSTMSLTGLLAEPLFAPLAGHAALADFAR